MPTDDRRDMLIFQSQFYILKLRKCVKTPQQNNSQLLSQIKCSYKNQNFSIRLQLVSHFEIFNGLGQVRKLDVFDLLRDVHVLDRGDRPSRGSTEAGLQIKILSIWLIVSIILYVVGGISLTVKKFVGKSMFTILKYLFGWFLKPVQLS